jgi:hypothetical protein
MPYGDQTGPAGMGPLTGRGAGYCAGFEQPGYMSPLPGRGAWFRAGRGTAARGGGYGYRHWYRATGLPGWQRTWGGYPAGPGAPWAPPRPEPEQELSALRSQVKFMEESVRQARERIQELEKQAEEK